MKAESGAAPPVAPPQAAPGLGDPPRLADLEQALVEGLGEHLPGLEILDRTLVLSGGSEQSALRADLVALDACGRLVLVSLVEGRADETVFVGLESVALLRSNRALIREYLASARLSASAPALVVLVAEGFSGRVLRTLAAVSPRELRLFEMRELSSAEGMRSSLVPVGVTSGSTRGDRTQASDDAEPSQADFLELLPLNLRPTAELAWVEIDRIDADLERRLSFDVVGWRYRRRQLCFLAWTGEDLLGFVASEDGSFHLRQVGDVHPFVDRVVGEHLRRLANENGLSNEDDAPRKRSGALRGVGQGSALEMNPGPLLTPEELAAFRD